MWKMLFGTSPLSFNYVQKNVVTDYLRVNIKLELLKVSIINIFKNSNIEQSYLYIFPSDIFYHGYLSVLML